MQNLKRSILVTGGCGFVGSSLAVKLKLRYPQNNIICFDNLKRRGSELNLNRLKELDIEFIHGDIRNIEDLDFNHQLDIIIDCCAEPSVLAGINENPNYLINTNLNGTVNCLNLAVKNNAKFVFLSTSRVYPINSLNEIAFEENQTRFSISKNQTLTGITEKGVSESFPLNDYRSLYGATKLASELLIAEYQNLLGLQTVVNRCGVLTGPYQMGKVDQGVVVLWMAKHFFNQSLKYFGYGATGKQVRDILHVNDLFELIDLQLNNFEKVNGKTYNVGGGTFSSVSLTELSEMCVDITGNKINIGSVAETRTADIRIYITDNTKIENELGWKPTYQPKVILNEIFDWIKVNESTLKNIL